MIVQRSKYLFLLMALTAVAFANNTSATSLYVEHQSRPLKTLSEKEITGYLAGEGMGMALAAELNRYPGPKHVLEMANDLALTPTQRDETQKLFELMQAEAQTVGHALVEKERELDHLFRTQAITEESLQRLTEEIGLLHGQVRYVHLQAHLVMREILSAKQQQIYQERRGYAGQPHSPAAHHH